MQSRLDELVGQEASLRLREQLFSQEKSLIQEQNRWLSAELESKSSELLLVRKEKDTLQADLQGKIISRDQEVRVYLYLISFSLSSLSTFFVNLLVLYIPWIHVHESLERLCTKHFLRFCSPAVVVENVPGSSNQQRQ